MVTVRSLRQVFVVAVVLFALLYFSMLFFVSISAARSTCPYKPFFRGGAPLEMELLLGEEKPSSGESRCEFGCDNEWFDKWNLQAMKETQSNVRGDKVSRAILEYLDDLGLSKRKTKLKSPSFWDVLASSLFLGGPEKFKIVGVGTSFPLRIAGICAQVQNCDMIAAVEPSRKALLAGVEMIRRVAPCATYLPVAKTIGNCSPGTKTCLLEYSESFDLVSAVQVIQHVERQDYPVVFSNVHHLVRSGGGLLSISEETGFPLIPDIDCFDLHKRGMSRVIPFQMVYGRMKACLNAELFGMWFVLTGRYEFKVLKCYENRDSSHTPYVWYDAAEEHDRTNTEPSKNVFEIMPWYAAKVFQKRGNVSSLSWKVPGLAPPVGKKDIPRGRLHVANLAGIDAMQSISCTSVLRKFEESKTTHLPSFEEQITELSGVLRTPDWDENCGSGLVASKLPFEQTPSYLNAEAGVGVVGDKDMGYFRSHW